MLSVKVCVVDSLTISTTLREPPATANAAAVSHSRGCAGTADHSHDVVDLFLRGPGVVAAGVNGEKGCH